MLSMIWKFIKYWYFRYLVVTELYMVEPWERMLMHVLFAVPIIGLWYFNYTIISEMTGFGEFAKMPDSRDINMLPASF
ncbi:ghiberti [Arctopsyche grandis]|uniref:ghiberti n=1 Tax=Arctopsyche grandis TaxID=121162 RepID=UPI00406D6AFB